MTNRTCTTNLKEKRDAVISLFKSDKSKADIVKLLKSQNICKMFMYRMIKRCEDIGCLDGRRNSGVKPTVTG